MATAHIIFTEIAAEKEEINFQTKVADHLTVTRQKENGLHTLDFPSRSADKVDLPNGLLSALRSETISVAVL